MGNKHGNINLPPPLPPPPKPHINMDALQKAVGVIGGVIALSPIGRLVELGIVSIADAASHVKASEFINNGHSVNTTLNLLPGGWTSDYFGVKLRLHIQQRIATAEYLRWTSDYFGLRLQVRKATAE